MEVSMPAPMVQMVAQEEARRLTVLLELEVVRKVVLELLVATLRLWVTEEEVQLPQE